MTCSFKALQSSIKAAKNAEERCKRSESRYVLRESLPSLQCKKYVKFSKGLGFFSYRTTFAI